MMIMIITITIRAVPNAATADATFLTQSPTIHIIRNKIFTSPIFIPPVLQSLLLTWWHFLLSPFSLTCYTTAGNVRLDQDRQAELPHLQQVRKCPQYVTFPARSILYCPLVSDSWIRARKAIIILRYALRFLRVLATDVQPTVLRRTLHARR